MGAHDKLRATQTNNPSTNRAFEEAARRWLELADDVERMDRVRLSLATPSNKRNDLR